jgi:hypothetical protein
MLFLAFFDEAKKLWGIRVIDHNADRTSSQKHLDLIA